jgi:hypothetical protein
MLRFWIISRIVDEKKKIELQLEKERKEKEEEIKEFLKQQETLLVEKESILNKLSKTQQKIVDLKKRQQHEKNAQVSCIQISSNSNKNEDDVKIPNLNSQDKNLKEQDSFNPYKVINFIL